MYASPKINENDNTDRFHVFCSKPVNLLKAIIIIKKRKKQEKQSLFNLYYLVLLQEDVGEQSILKTCDSSLPILCLKR